MTEPNSPERMTRTQREDLRRLARERGKQAKDAAVAYGVKLRADFDDALAATFSYDQPAVWKQAMENAQKAVEKAQAEIEAESAALGIPKRFAPSLSIGWSGRGENATKDRRAELRKAAYARIDAQVKQACTRIDGQVLEATTQLLAATLSGPALLALLEMPSVETLLDTVSMAEARALVMGERQRALDSASTYMRGYLAPPDDDDDGVA